MDGLACINGTALCKNNTPTMCPTSFYMVIDPLEFNKITLFDATLIKNNMSEALAT